MSCSIGPAPHKPRLLVLASTYPRWRDDPEPGFVHELAKRLIDDFDVSVLCPHAPGAAGNEIMDSVNVIRYRYAREKFETLVNDGGIVANLKRAKWKLLLVPGFVLMQAWHAWRLVRANKVDVVHAHWLLPQGLVASLLGVPFVVTSHGADLYALKGRLLDALKRFVVRKSAAATVVSSAMRDKLEQIGADISKVSVLPMGVDLAGRFFPDASVVRSRDEILFVGRLVEKKGVEYLLRALPEILRQWPSAFLTVAGFGPDEPRLRAIIGGLGLSQKVRFLGARPQAELPALYRRAAVFVAPFVRAASGDEEGLGLVLVEAIGCGCPIVVGDVPAVTDVLGDAVADFSVDPCNVQALTKRVVDTLTNVEGASIRASSLLAAVVGKFEWTDVAAAYAWVLK